MSNLSRRILVAALAIPALLFLAYRGGFAFFGFVALVSALSLLEYHALARSKGAAPPLLMAVGVGVVINLAFIYDRLSMTILGALDHLGIAVRAPTMAQFLLIVLLTAVPLLTIVELLRNRGSALINLAVSVFGWMYYSLFFGSLIGIREIFNPLDFPVSQHFAVIGPGVPEEVVATIDRWGGLTVIAILAAVWTCDSAAYFIGRWRGRHPLFKRVSPNKTWEGAGAGFVASVGTFLLLQAWFLPYLTIADGLFCGVAIGTFGQIGDLAESLLKRDSGVKDSSLLIPGHGGMLDRFDSLVFVAPVLFLYLDFVVFSY